ncbi:MAG: 16S rRNA (cytosine(967)-C(5))-methyltransferase RsmB [Aerococcus sp.]|nr:16S rRNA (cytosine(967)-C(5))-methyltransferase RsmB [Aerococcus sp.]
MANKSALLHSARYQAMLLLSEVMQEKVFINEGLAKVLDSGRIPERDQALTTQLVYGTMQYHYTLDRLLKSFIKRPKQVKRWAWELLALSSYQYFYLDQIPPHAIVNEAVEIAKQRGNATVARFVNGVLRHMLRQYQTIDQAIATLASSEQDAIAMRYSLPEMWLDYFIKRFGIEEAERLAKSLVMPSHVNVRINQTKGWSLVQVQAELEKLGYISQPSAIAPNMLQIEQGNPSTSSLFAEGVITIQDESASLAVEMLAPKPGEHVLDACAAPGGKTVQLAEAVGKTGQVESLDLDATKLPRIEANISRMGVGEWVNVRAQDARELHRVYKAEQFDRILVDAPCSGVGLFRRKPDTKQHKTLADLKALQRIQLEILDAATPLLKKGGHFVYSTCTITTEENEQVVSAYLKQHPEMQLVPIILPEDQPLKQALTKQGTLEILPHYFNSDGFFIAHFIKTTDQTNHE